MSLDILINGILAKKNPVYSKLLTDSSTKEVVPKEIRVQNIPWLNAEILKMIKIRNKVFHRKKGEPIMKNVKLTFSYFLNRASHGSEFYFVIARNSANLCHKHKT